jgi:tetratricopeptide (TPR) repeat protein
VIGLFNEFDDILTLALIACRAVEDIRIEGKVEQQLARIAVVREDYATALRHIERAEDIARQTADDLELGLALTTHMDILSDLGQMAEAEEIALAALRIGEQLQNLDISTSAAYRMSAIEAKRGSFQSSTEWLNRAEQSAEHLNSSRRLSSIIARRGMNAALQGDWLSAEKCFTNALMLDTTRGERRYIAHNKLRLAEVYAHTGQLQAAQQVAGEARDIYERCGLTARLERVDQLLHQIQTIQQSTA